MNAPFDRDDLSRESERNWQARDLRERLERRGDVDYVSKPQQDLQELRLKKAIERLHRHQEWGKQP